MCIICVSPKGTRQPSKTQIKTMFTRNPHGAGYMYARNGKVIIHKGFMYQDEYLDAIASEHFTARDTVVYHFRISTQAGINPEMTHPFPLSNQRRFMHELDIECECGVAHNGIIRLTSDPREQEYSDTAIFITDYLTNIIQSPADLRNQEKLNHIYRLAQSKFAILARTGDLATVGEFINERGLLFSNRSYMKEGRL